MDDNAVYMSHHIFTTAAENVHQNVNVRC